MCQQQTDEDDSDTESRTNYAESSESADDVAMSTDANMAETEVAETLDHERYAKGNKYTLFRFMMHGVYIAHV